MKKLVLSILMLCCFAFNGVAQQNANGLTLQKSSDFAVMASNDRETTEMILLTYIEEDFTQYNLVGLGLAFSWGSMYPASMLAQYAGNQLGQVVFIDSGEDYAGNYRVDIYLGGDAGGETLVAQKNFQVDGMNEGNFMFITLDTPVNIDGTQNLWIMFYQDGSVQYPAPGIDDIGEPNSRWIMVEGYGWMDANSVGGTYSWIVYGILDDYDVIGENAEEVNVYPNPTSNFVTVQANGMNHITVLNTLGQMVYDANVDGDIQKLDMSQYEAGVYMVRVATENGTSVQRVVVK